MIRPHRRIYATVTGLHQSSLNGLRWLLDLSCKHEKWITNRSRPKSGVRVVCPTCSCKEKR